MGFISEHFALKSVPWSTGFPNMTGLTSERFPIKQGLIGDPTGFDRNPLRGREGLGAQPKSQANSRPRIGPVPVEKVSVSMPRRCRRETKRLVNG